MNTSKRVLSVAFAAAMAGGATIGTATAATAATVPAANGATFVAAQQQSAAVTITIDDFAYSVSGPVTPGATVTVVNNDDVPHTATDAEGAFDTGIIDAGATATFTAPQEPGEYTLTCTIHPNMSGTMVVEAAQGGSMGGDEMGDGGSSAGQSDDMDDGAAAPEQQVSPMPEGGADTGVTGHDSAANLGVLALGGGLVLVAAAGGTYAVRRRAADRG